MKRITFLIVVAILTLVTVTGCSLSSNNQESSTVTTVRVWTSDAGAKALWEEFVDEFNRGIGKEKGIKIEWTTYGSDYDTITEGARANDQLPEILGLNKPAAAIKAGDILAIQDIEGWDAYLNEIVDYPGLYKDIETGKIYSPATRTVTVGLVYNRDLFKKAGIVDENGEPTPPKTFAEAREYAKRITNKSENIYGWGFPLKSGFNWTLKYPSVNSYGELGWPVYDYDRLTVSFDNLKEPMQWLLSLKSDGSLFPGAEGLDNDTMRAYFAEGKIGMSAGASWDVGVLTTQFVANCDWDVAPFPILSSGVSHSAYCTYSGYHFIAKTALNVDTQKLLEVYRFITSIDTQKAKYEQNIALPARKDVVEVADTSKIIPQWMKFGQLFDDKRAKLENPSLKIEGDNEKAVLEKVWVGSVSIDDAISDLNKRYSEAFKRAAADGTVDIKIYKEYNEQQLRRVD